MKFVTLVTLVTMIYSWGEVGHDGNNSLLVTLPVNLDP